MTPPSRRQVESFFDPATFTLSHIVWDQASAQCALIDSVLDHDPKSGRTDMRNADRLPDHAGVDPAFGSRQHARGPHAACRGQWHHLPEDSDQRRLTHRAPATLPSQDATPP